MFLLPGTNTHLKRLWDEEIHFINNSSLTFVTSNIEADLVRNISKAPIELLSNIYNLDDDKKHASAVECSHRRGALFVGKFFLFFFYFLAAVLTNLKVYFIMGRKSIPLPE